MGESTPAADPPSPAALLPEPSRRTAIAWYAGAAVVTAVILSAGLRLDRVSLREPLDYDMDALLIMPMVRTTVEGGTHWRIDRMGFPGVYELYDFPVIDHLHFAAIWLIGRVVSDWVLVFNLYHLLTWPLTTLTAMWAFRRLGLTLPLAAAGGILYAFQPFHYYRGEAHYFLAAYWVVPLSWLPALAVAKGDLPFFSRRPDGGYGWALRTRAAGWLVVLAAATASAGAYYAFFACAVYGAAGVYGWVAHRTWRAAASAGLVAGLVVAFGLVNHLPTVLHSREYGRTSVTERTPWESELYGLKIAHLVLPVDAHNLTEFRRARAAYANTFYLQNENAFATLGAVGTVGLLGLLGVLFFPTRAGWPYRPAAALALFIVLFSTIGGFGAVFNLLVFDQIRCLNRFSIYLAFLCLLAVVWALDRWLSAPMARRFRLPVAAGLVAVGVADQTPGAWFNSDIVTQIELSADRFRADRRFFARVEEAVPGGRVFCLPYMPFPEVPPVHELKAYEHGRVYLHSATLASGYGAIKFREADEWLKSVSFADPANRLRRMVARGFDGVLIDGRGFLSQADANRVVQEFEQHAPAGRPFPKIIHEDGVQVFLDLRPYREWLRATGPNLLAQWEREEREWVAACFIRGFLSHEPYGAESRNRWVYRTAVLQFVNPSDRDRTFVFVATFDTNHEEEFPVRVVAPPGVIWADRPGGPAAWDDRFVVGAPPKSPKRLGDRRVYTLVIKPGRHDVRFECTPPRHYITGDTRPICYYLSDIGFTEAR